MTRDIEGHSEGKSEVRSDLQMAPEQMLALARKAAELLVERIERLPGRDAWEGDFRQGLEDQLLEEPPEAGRPAVEVLEQAAREILPVAVQHDHPRFFGFIPSAPTWPSVLADDTAVARLSAFLVSRSAGGVTSEFQDGRCQVRFHLEH